MADSDPFVYDMVRAIPERVLPSSPEISCAHVKSEGFVLDVKPVWLMLSSSNVLYLLSTEPP